jgi:hypothetical protein
MDSEKIALQKKGNSKSMTAKQEGLAGTVDLEK